MASTKCQRRTESKLNTRRLQKLRRKPDYFERLITAGSLAENQKALGLNCVLFVSRSIAVNKAAWPYVTVIFNDTDAPSHPDVDNHIGTVEQGRIVYSVANDFGYDQINDAIADSSTMWLSGASFLQIWRKHVDV